MTVVADEMLIRIAADTAQLRNDMNDMRRQVGGSFDDIKDRASSLKSALGSLFAGVAVGAMAKQFVETADAMALMDARLKQTTGNAAAFSEAQKEIYRIAQANSSGLQETAELFTKMNEPVKRLGGGVKETAAIVDAFSTSMRLGGASTQEASAATLQFAQAMGSGKLQGDEFRSIAEASPRFMKAMADGMGVPIEKLKEMGSEGKLTADVVGNALIKSLGDLKSEAGSMPDTVGGAFQRMKNDLMVAVNDLNKNSGLTLGIANLISSVNELIPTIKSELAGAFQAVGSWIERNRDDLREIWVAAIGVVGDVWEIAKAMASVVGFTLEAGNKMGVLKTVLETIRFLIAGFEDGVAIIGAAFAKVGADIITYVAAPLNFIMKTVGAVADMAGLAVGKAMMNTVMGVENIASKANAYADSVHDSFARGESAVGRLNAELLKNKEAAKAAADGGQVASEVMDTLAGSAGKAAGGLVTLKNKNAEATKEQKAAVDEYNKLIKSITDKNAAVSGELTQQAKLTDGQKLALKIMNDLRDGTLKLTAAQKIKVTAALEDMLVTEKLTEAQKEDLAIQKEVRDQRAKDAEALLKQSAAMDEQTKKLEDENAVLQGLYKSVEEIELARLKDQRAILAQTVAQERLLGYCNDETEAHRETLRALNDLIAAREDNVHLKAAKESAEEWKKTSDSINNSLTDSLMRAFESGKGFGEAFLDSLKNTAKTTILQPTIKAIMAPISGAIGSFFGMTGTANAATDGGGGLMSMLSGGKSLWDAMSGGFNNFSASVTSNVAGLGEWLSGNGMEGLGGLLGNNALGIGNFAGALGGFGAGMGIGNMISGKYSLGGSSNIATGLGSAIGAIWGPLGSAIGGALGGLVNRAFGRGPKEIEEAGITGEISGGWVRGQNYENWKQKGGWFRSDKDGVNLTGLYQEQQVLLNNAAMSVFQNVKGMAEALRLPTDQIANITTNLKVKLTGKAEEDSAAINSAMEQYQTALSNTYSSQVAQFQKNGETIYETMQRLATIQLSREMLNQFGGIFSIIASSGVAATEAMIGLAGGLDNLIAKSSQFVRDFYTEEEQMGMSARSLLEQLKGAGVAGAGQLSTKDEYRALVESLDVNNSSQREQLNALLTLGPQFAQLAGYMAENKLSLDEVAAAAPLIAALDPLFTKQVDATVQNTTAIDATTQAVTGVAAAVHESTSSIVGAINSMVGAVSAAVSAANASSAEAIASLSARVAAQEDNARLSASQPYY